MTQQTIAIKTVKMTNGTIRLRVETPYSAAFVTAARGLGGKWDATAKVWRFDPRDEARVRAAVLDCYGWSEYERPDLVQVVVSLPKGSYGWAAEIAILSRSLVWRPGRDTSVRLGDGVTILRGGFPARGGSAKNPRLEAEDGTILLVRDVPRRLAENYEPRGNGQNQAVAPVTINIFEADATTDEIEDALNRERLFGPLGS